MQCHDLCSAGGCMQCHDICSAGGCMQCHDLCSAGGCMQCHDLCSAGGCMQCHDLCKRACAQEAMPQGSLCILLAYCIPKSRGKNMMEDMSFTREGVSLMEGVIWKAFAREGRDFNIGGGGGGGG